MGLSFETMAVTEGEADAYALARGLSDWTLAASGKAEALRRGQDFVAGAYNHRWISDFDNASAPSVVKYAIFEAAAREVKVPFCLTPDITLGRSKIMTEIEGVKWDLLKSDPSIEDLKPTITSIEMLLANMVLRSFGAMVV